MAVKASSESAFRFGIVQKALKPWSWVQLGDFLVFLYYALPLLMMEDVSFIPWALRKSLT